MYHLILCKVLCCCHAIEVLQPTITQYLSAIVCDDIHCSAMFLFVAMQREALRRQKVAGVMQLMTAQHSRLSKGKHVSAQEGNDDDDDDTK